MKRIVNKDIPGRQKGISRREFVKTTGATGLALATGAGVGYFAGRAPALAQAREVHVLAWSHFIKEADALMRNELIPEFKRASGISVTYETISGKDLNGRAKAAMKRRAGPDIFQFLFNMPHLYAKGLENHDALASEVGVEGHYDFHTKGAKVDGVMRGIPY
ncbi:MAG: twin-arginine translocation signal domain-containing protein, partial [SAR324 cluster bacterium]|nr:twin-arginine translocation signal domain-containing protein [SAR324 cluster bacterium]